MIWLDFDQSKLEEHLIEGPNLESELYLGTCLYAAL